MSTCFIHHKLQWCVDQSNLVEPVAVEHVQRVATERSAVHH